MNNSLAEVLTSDDLDDINTAAGLTNAPTSLADLISGGTLNITDIMFFFAGAAFVVYMLSGGIKLMLSKADPNAVGEAKQMITNAFIGIIIVIVSYWIVQLAGIILKLPGINDTF